MAATPCGWEIVPFPTQVLPISAENAKRPDRLIAWPVSRIPSSKLNVAEIYDSYSGVEIQAYEDLGFCAYGEGGPAAADSLFDLTGQLPVNTSGGLLGRGAPVGATGIAQAIEIMLQLRGEADSRRQVSNARLGLTDTHAGTGTHCVVNLFKSDE